MHASVKLYSLGIRITAKFTAEVFATVKKRERTPESPNFKTNMVGRVTS